jgi:voltage-gated potassium channel
MPVCSVDEYGVKNYSITSLMALGVGLIIAAIFGFAWVFLQLEAGHPDANVTTYSDAVWLMAMASSTIGFGDFYPVSLGGRFITFIMFILGIGLMGFVGGLVASKLLGWSDTNVKNRELRSQNAEILEMLKDLNRRADTNS